MTRGTVVALHGFGGSGRSWDAVADGVRAAGAAFVAPDLRGHGARSADRPVDLASVVADVVADLRRVAGDPGRTVLAGYSQGGRVALHVALAEPGLVDAVVLVSSTPGIEDETARAARRAADEERARDLERDGAAAFADRWVRLPLWDGDPPAAREAQRREMAAADPDGLAAALRGLGAGAVPAVGHRLATLAADLTVVTGGRDARYGAIGRRALDLAAQPAGEVVVPGAGHGLLREAPAAVVGTLVARL